MDERSDAGYGLRPLKWYKQLDSGKGRAESGFFLVEGERAIKQIIENHAASIAEILTIDDPPPVYEAYPVRRVTESQFKSVCLTRTPQGTLALVRLPREAYSSVPPADAGGRILLLEDVQDPGNVGSLIRSAVAFGYSGVVMSDGCADPFSPKCVQSTAGTVLSLWVRRSASYMSAVADLKRRGYSLVATDTEGTDDPRVLCGREKLILALGNEASGLSQSLVEVSDYCCGIPIARERAESLNVAACGAICMYISASETR